MTNNAIKALKIQSTEELIPDVEAMLQKLKNESFGDILLYDVKDEWISKMVEITTGKMKKNGKILKEVKENFCIEVQNITPLQKMCCYKISKTGVDCDVSLRNIIIYALVYEMPDTTLECQKTGYQKFCLKRENFDYRGDTMNSYSTTMHEFFRLFGDDRVNPKVLRINQKGHNAGKLVASEGFDTWEECILCNYDYFKDILPCEAHEFIRLNHTIGNFIPVPFKSEDVSFNVPRNKSMKDYWDLTLLHIYNWYNANGNLLKMLGNEDSVKLCEEWLKGFTNNEGQPSWNAFIKRNYLEDFVGEKDMSEVYGKPLELWDGHFESKNLMPVSRREFIQFFERTAKMILARGYRMATKVKEKLQDEKTTKV